MVKLYKHYPLFSALQHPMLKMNLVFSIDKESITEKARKTGKMHFFDIE